MGVYQVVKVCFLPWYELRKVNVQQLRDIENTQNRENLGAANYFSKKSQDNGHRWSQSPPVFISTKLVGEP